MNVGAEVISLGSVWCLMAEMSVRFVCVMSINKDNVLFVAMKIIQLLKCLPYTLKSTVKRKLHCFHKHISVSSVGVRFIYSIIQIGVFIL